MKRIRSDGPRLRPNADAECQIQTRSSSQQSVIDAEPTTSQSHQNTEDGQSARKRKVNLVESYGQLKSQKIYKQTKEKQNLRKQKFAKQQCKFNKQQRMRQKLHNQPQHLREQPSQIGYDSEIIDQSTNLSDRTRLLSVQCPLDSRIDCKLESTERELQNQPQHQLPALSVFHQQPNIEMNNVIEKHEQEQGPFNVHNPESHEKLHKFENQQGLQRKLQNQQPEQLSEQPQKTSSVQDQQYFGIEGMIEASPMNTNTNFWINEIINKGRMQLPPKAQIETRSSSQECSIDTQSTTSQCHRNTEDGESAPRRKIYEQTKVEQNLGEQLFAEQRQQYKFEENQRMGQEFYHQPEHLREQPRQIRYNSEIIDQSTNLSNRTCLLSIQSSLDSRIDGKSESTERELEKPKQQISRLELGNQQQHQRQLEKNDLSVFHQQPDIEMNNVIEKHEQEQGLFNVNKAESHEKLHKFENQQGLQLELPNQQPEQLQPRKTSSVQEEQDFEVDGMVEGSPMNTHTDFLIDNNGIVVNKIIKKGRMQNQTENVIETVKQPQQKIREHLQQQYQQGHDVSSNCDNIFIRRISESELTSLQKSCLGQSGNQIQEHYREQDMIEQPSKEVRSTPINPTNLHQPLLLDDLELEEVVVQEQQQQHYDMQQGLTERSRSDEIEVGIEIKENTHHNTDLSIDKTVQVMNGNPEHAGDFYQQYLPEIIRLYNYSSTFQKLIEDFVGTAGSDQHYFIEESLTRTLLELDRIPAENCQQLRFCRRQVIKYIYDLMEKLDNKVQVAQ